MFMDRLTRRQTQTSLGVQAKPAGSIMPGASANLAPTFKFSDLINTIGQVKKNYEEGVADPIAHAPMADLEAQRKALNAKTQRSKPQMAPAAPKVNLQGRETLSTDVDPTKPPPPAPVILPMDTWQALREARRLKADLLYYSQYQNEARDKWQRATDAWNEEMRVTRLTEAEQQEMLEQERRQQRVEHMRRMASMSPKERLEYQMELDEQDAAREAELVRQRQADEELEDIDAGQDVLEAEEQSDEIPPLDQPAIKPIVELESIDSRPLALWPLVDRFQRMCDLRRQTLLAESMREMREERLRTMASDAQQQRAEGNMDAHVDEDERNALLRALNEDDASLISAQAQLEELIQSLDESDHLCAHPPSRVELHRMTAGRDVTLEHLQYSIRTLSDDIRSIGSEADRQPLTTYWQAAEQRVVADHYGRIHKDEADSAVPNGDEHELADKEEVVEQQQDEAVDEGEEVDEDQNPEEMSEDELEAAREAEMDGESGSGARTQRFRQPRKPSAAKSKQEFADEAGDDEELDEVDEDEDGPHRAVKVPGGYDELESEFDDPDDIDEGPRSERKRAVSTTPVVSAAAPAVPWSLRDQREGMSKMQKNAAVGYGRRIRDMRTKDSIEVFHIQTLASLAGAMQVSLGEITKKLRELDVRNTAHSILAQHLPFFARQLALSQEMRVVIVTVVHAA